MVAMPIHGCTQESLHKHYRGSLLDMFVPDDEGNVVLEPFANAESIFVVCACMNIKLFIWDTVPYKPGRKLSPTVVMRAILPSEKGVTLKEVHILRHFSVDGAGSAQPHYDFIEMEKSCLGPCDPPPDDVSSGSTHDTRSKAISGASGHEKLSQLGLPCFLIPNVPYMFFMIANFL